jgi:hypothetical protein
MEVNVSLTRYSGKLNDQTQTVPVPPKLSEIGTLTDDDLGQIPQGKLKPIFGIPLSNSIRSY